MTEIDDDLSKINKLLHESKNEVSYLMSRYADARPHLSAVEDNIEKIQKIIGKIRDELPQ